MRPGIRVMPPRSMVSPATAGAWPAAAMRLPSRVTLCRPGSISRPSNSLALVKVSMAVSPASVLAWRAVSAELAWAARGGDFGKGGLSMALLAHGRLIPEVGKQELHRDRGLRHAGPKLLARSN